MLSLGFSWIISIRLKIFPSSLLSVFFYHDRVLDFVRCLFSIYRSDHVVFVLYATGIWYIALIDYHMVNHCCLSGINSTWYWCITHFRYYWIWFVSILRIFLSVDIGLYFFFFFFLVSFSASRTRWYWSHKMSWEVIFSLTFLGRRLWRIGVNSLNVW